MIYAYNIKRRECLELTNHKKSQRHFSSLHCLVTLAHRPVTRTLWYLQTFKPDWTPSFIPHIPPSSALTPRLCFWSVETNTYDRWSKTSRDAAPGTRQGVYSMCMRGSLCVCVFVCERSVMIHRLLSWAACPTLLVGRPLLLVLLCVCVCVRERETLWEGIPFRRRQVGLIYGRLQESPPSVASMRANLSKACLHAHADALLLRH